MDEDYYDQLNLLPRYIENYLWKNYYSFIMKLRIKIGDWY